MTRLTVAAAIATFAFAGSALAAPGGNPDTGPTGEPGDHRSCKAWAEIVKMEAQDYPGGHADVVHAAQDGNPEVGNSGHGVPTPTHSYYCDPKEPS